MQVRPDGFNDHKLFGKRRESMMLVQKMKQLLRTKALTKKTIALNIRVNHKISLPVIVL